MWDCVVQVAKFGKPTIVAKMGFPVFRGMLCCSIRWMVFDLCICLMAQIGVGTCTQRLNRPPHPAPQPKNNTTAVGGLLLLHWCWGILENVCNYLRINFVYLLDLSPKNVSSPRSVAHCYLLHIFVGRSML